MNEWERLRRQAKQYKEMYPPGTRGTVKYVDAIGQIGISWDNGQSLSLVPGEDSFCRLTEEELAVQAIQNFMKRGEEIAE